jgi:hypothetical protein
MRTLLFARALAYAKISSGSEEVAARDLRDQAVVMGPASSLEADWRLEADFDRLPSRWQAPNSSRTGGRVSLRSCDGVMAFI